ncbi:MAG: D-alanine--D-alanine ligase, partial [Actinobacteria bacterium]|nr:D-alanine--D-alanine ligase [Actinomycetota bacterium]
NTIPGLTETSTMPLAAEAAGLSFEDLVAVIMESAFR